MEIPQEYIVAKINVRSFERFQQDLEPVLDVSMVEGSRRYEVVSEIVGDEIAVYVWDKHSSIVFVTNVPSTNRVEKFVKDIVQTNSLAAEEWDCLYDKFGVIREHLDK